MKSIYRFRIDYYIKVGYVIQGASSHRKAVLTAHDLEEALHKIKTVDIDFGRILSVKFEEIENDDK